MKERKREVTIETCEVFVIGRRGSLGHAWCDGCGTQASVIGLDDACMPGLLVEAIRRQAEAGRIHLIERPGGSSLICLNSIIQP